MNDDHAANPLVLDHFMNPRNIGDVSEPDGVGEVGAASCGDVVRISFKVQAGKIVEARFRTYGCGTAIACSSMATELIQGRTIEEAGQLSKEQVSRAFGGLPATKAHCPILAEEAVKAAVADYHRRRASV